MVRKKIIEVRCGAVRMAIFLPSAVRCGAELPKFPKMMISSQKLAKSCLRSLWMTPKGGCFDSNEDEQDLLEFNQIKESMFTI